jgi:uncharacterized protein (TIGR00266 family)
MQYEIEGGKLPVVTLKLQRGEQVFTETGGMAWMTEGIGMDTNMEGGLLGGLTRAFSGESLFLVTYTAEQDSAEIAFASSMPGTIMDPELSPGYELVCQKHSFLVAERSVELSVHFHRRFGAGLFGGEGFVLQRLSGQGRAFVEIDGAVVERELAARETLKVDPGHIAMFEGSVDFSLDRVKGIKNIFFGGEGLFLARLTGPGKVWLQTMPVPNLVRSLIPFLPDSSN